MLVLWLQLVLNLRYKYVYIDDFFAQRYNCKQNIKLQGLVGAIFEGIGVSAGSFIGGIMFDKVGGSRMFLIYGIAVLVFCVIHMVLQFLLQRYSNVHGKSRCESDAVPGDSVDVNNTITNNDLLLTGKGKVDEKEN